MNMICQCIFDYFFFLNTKEYQLVNTGKTNKLVILQLFNKAGIKLIA